MLKTKRTKNRKFVFPLILILILIAGGAVGYYYWNKSTQTTTITKTTLRTAQTRRGNITISVTGSGTSASSQKASLGFSTSGTVGTVNVKVGDKVTLGQVVAQLGDIASVKASVTSAELDLLTSQKALDDLRLNASANIANARVSLVAAQKAYDDAKSAIKQKGEARCNEATTTGYYDAYLKQKNHLDAVNKNENGNQDYYVSTILPAKTATDKAYATYMYCLGYTDYEITLSQAELTLAEIKLNKAKSTLDTLIKNNGVDPLTEALAKNKVASSELALEKAKKVLDGVAIKAPFTGTILTVVGKVGDSAGTAAFITMADLEHPLVDFSVDEADMAKVIVGETANVVFDSSKIKTYIGKVTKVNVNVETVSGYSVIKGQVTLDLSAEKTVQSFPEGMNASVEIINAQTLNAVLVPIAAVRSLGGTDYGVFVLNQNGSPRLKVVTIGLKNSSYAEIKSGVAMGDVVTTGLAETK